MTSATFRLWTHGSGVLATNVGSKLFVTLAFVLLLHLIQRFATERARRLKRPVTLGAAEALKALAHNPYQLARHGGSISPTLFEKEQCSEADTCLKSGRGRPSPQEEEA